MLGYFDAAHAATRSGARKFLSGELRSAGVSFRVDAMSAARNNQFDGKLSVALYGDFRGIFAADLARFYVDRFLWEIVFEDFEGLTTRF